jgi:type II secretory pathway pseudopilin PulG
MKRKQGISLIVLVITIIVMIILAASVVLTLNNTGIITKANDATSISDRKQI